MIFTTYRLLIRKALPTDEDIEMFFRLWTDGRVMVNVGFPNGIPTTRENIRRRLEAAGNSVYDQLLVIQHKSNGRLMGECKLGLPNEEGNAETDIKLLPEYWGHSYGVEVKRGLLDYLFTHTDCRAVHASPNINNIPSLRMQEAVGGMRISEGVFEFPEQMRDFTCPVHCYIYEVTRQTWEALPSTHSPGNISVLIKATHELTPEEQELQQALLKRVFHDDPYNTLSWASPDWNILVYNENVLAAQVEIVERTITVGEQPVHVGGIGGVATLPEFRGRGLATHAMSHAAQYIKKNLGREFGLLITGERRSTFYEGIGWQFISEPVYFDQPSGKIKNDGITMFLALTKKSWPLGIVDLGGLPW
jgi:RimJ/RimL family protein N-acetyltransferase